MIEANYIERPALHIEQPLGDFFAFSLDATTLNRITYSLPAEVQARIEKESSDLGSGYRIFGSQREEKPKRLDEIAKFIQSSDATFPNAIILAANYDNDGNLIEDESKRWSVRLADKMHVLKIPDSIHPSASIIDGQHRLHAFQRVPERAPERSMELLCVAFLDLPTPYHAYVFATINFNQRKVDRSLAYELFGFDVEERSPRFWVPETLAVYLARVLNTESSSPLYKCIQPAANVESLFSGEAEGKDAAIRVSMATVVDGILRLISKKPKDDRYIMRHPDNLERGRSSLAAINELPLRSLYIKGNDKAIYDIVANFFGAVQDTLWRVAAPPSYIRKTVGIQALFDILRIVLAKEQLTAARFSRSALTQRLKPCEALDPQGDKYQASGIGRSEIRKDILEALQLD